MRNVEHGTLFLKSVHVSTVTATKQQGIALTSKLGRIPPKTQKRRQTQNNMLSDLWGPGSEPEALSGLFSKLWALFGYKLYILRHLIVRGYQNGTLIFGKYPK